MSTPNPIPPIEQAAIPTAIVVAKALKTFITTVTSAAPADVPVVASGALKVFLGTVELQAPALASSELAAARTEANATVDGWISKLEALQQQSSAVSSAKTEESPLTTIEARQ